MLSFGPPRTAVPPPNAFKTKSREQMGIQMAGPTYCGWVQVVVLDRFPLLQDPQFLESLYQQLYLHLTWFFWDIWVFSEIFMVFSIFYLRKWKEWYHQRHTEWLCISLMLVPGLQSFMHSLFVSSIRLYSSSWGQSRWGFKIQAQIFKTPHYTNCFCSIYK